MEKSANLEIHKELKTQHHGEVDRISDLPDHVLLHVISFLPIRSAVATCILSKRWKDIWTGIMTLDLTDCSKRLKSDEDYNSFKNFLDKILLCKDVPCLQLVKFHLSGGLDHLHAIKWITLLMKRGIRKLELNSQIGLDEEMDKLMLLFASSLTSHELIELKLRGDLLIRFPVSLHLPLLKVVWLDDIDFVDGKSVRNLLSGCPILESLSIDRCNGEGNIDLHSYSLKSLSINDLDWPVDDVVTINAPNLHDLDIMDLHSICVISAPNLRHLFLSMLSRTNYRMDNMPSLVDAYISIGYDRKKMVETLHRVRSSKFMTLASISLLVNNDRGLPVFSNLTQLNVTMSSSSWPAILQILVLAPNLKYLVASFDDDDDPEWSSPPCVPDCKLVLEEVKIRGFDGDIFMFGMILYILTNAKFLKKMVVEVFCDFEHLIEKITEVLEMLAIVFDCDCDIIVY